MVAIRAAVLAVVALSVGVPGLAVAAETTARPAPAAPRLSVKPPRGFVDDAFALDAAGKRLVVIRTDREEFQRVEIFDLEAAPPTVAGGFELTPPMRVVESIAFLPDGESLLLVGPGSDGVRVAETTDFTGKVRGRMNLPAAFAIAGSGRDAKLVMYERRESPSRSGEVTHVVSPFTLPALKPAGKPRSHVVGGDGALRPGGLVPVAFFDGYSKLLARRPGAYDKKKDARQPDGQAVLDLLSGKVMSTAPIADVYGWARLQRLRSEQPNRTAFVQLAGLNAGPAVPGDAAVKAATGVELVDPAGRLTRLELAVPFRLYDRLTLKDQEGPSPGVLTFALEVDPVNVDAVARKKADARALDVYDVQGVSAVAAASVEQRGQARLRVRIGLDAQPIVWSAAGDRLAVLRRFKSFARGGDRLDVYDLGN